MEKLKELIEKCKAAVSIDINEHRSCYETVIDYINGFDGDIEEIDKEILDEMIKRETVIRIQFYPNTPVGFFVCYHYDIEMCVEVALSNL